MDPKPIYINAIAKNMPYNFGIITVSKLLFH